MESSFPRRRRARPACPWQSQRQVLLCSCLALGAQTITRTQAWVPATAPSQASMRRSGHTATSTGSAWSNYAPLTTSRGAFSARKTNIESRFGKSRQQALGSSWAGAPSRQVVSRPGQSRRPAGALMSMAEEGGGAEESDHNTVLGALAIAGLGAVYYGLHDHVGGGGGGGAWTSFDAVLETARAGPSAATTAIQSVLTSSVSKVEELGPLGPVYFGALYVLAEVLIIPAIPLTTAAGFLFGVAGGTAVVLASAMIAAAISFQLGRTLLRQQVEGLLNENPKFRAIDNAIAKEGFKIILLLRLSPIFPFALSNYLYGVTSVEFGEYLAGTCIGFLPGTFAYVYGGTLGKAITDGGGDVTLPWYGYLAGATIVAFLLKTVGDIATNAIEEIEPGMRDE